MNKIVIVNCYYCKGKGRALDAHGRAPLGRAKDPCETCGGEGRLRIGPEGEILGPQPMCADERIYDSHLYREHRAAVSRGTSPR